MTDISSCRRKEANGGQQASLLSNSLHQRGDKCHGLLWPDAFTKGAYSPTVLNAASRLQWCREHKNWTTDQWSRVLFTDESRFSTRSDSQRVLIWKKIGTRVYTRNIKERHYYGGPEVLVWGGIMLNGQTELHIFNRGSIIGDRYCEEILLPHVPLFRCAIGPEFIFMDDNARPHRTLAVEELLESEDLLPRFKSQRTCVGCFGKTYCSTLTSSGEHLTKLKQMLIEEWVLLPQELLHQLVLSMRRRCE
ncbi:transposable element Tcb2 transposase [Trichonephila clavipes]|nr:transposable element Tcb2 transposase [Trichonephila clavipes]